MDSLPLGIITRLGAVILLPVSARRSMTSKQAAVKATATPDQTARRQYREVHARCGIAGGAAASNRASRSFGTGSGGKGRSRAFRNSQERSEFGSFSGSMIRFLIRQQ